MHRVIALLNSIVIPYSFKKYFSHWCIDIKSDGYFISQIDSSHSVHYGGRKISFPGITDDEDEHGDVDESVSRTKSVF